MLSPRLALAAAVAVLALSGCSQDSAANDNATFKQGDRTITPPTVLRTPVRVPSAPAVIETGGTSEGGSSGSGAHEEDEGENDKH